MSRTPRKPPLVLDLDFNEALKRYAKTDINELPDNIRLKKKGAESPPDPQKRSKR